MNYIANKVLMIRPTSFGYNPQTAESNTFQKVVDLSEAEVQEKAVKEFDAMTERLKKLGIEVLVFSDTQQPHTPDAVFPNNWFSTHSDGRLCLYPMEAEARRFERNGNIVDFLKSNFDVTQILDLSKFESANKFLEGTGSLVLDHKNTIAYASISSRTNEDVLDKWALAMGFDVVKFHSFDRQNTAIYHTNVMMCVGDKFAVICLESIADIAERKALVESLENNDKEIVEISFEQLENFAGNMLLLKSASNDNILVMSGRAFGSLSKEQIETLESHAKLESFDIDIIEKCGGGSVRCMIAEIFYQN